MEHIGVRVEIPRDGLPLSRRYPRTQFAVVEFVFRGSMPEFIQQAMDARMAVEARMAIQRIRSKGHQIHLLDEPMLLPADRMLVNHTAALDPVRGIFWLQGLADYAVDDADAYQGLEVSSTQPEWRRMTRPDELCPVPGPWHQNGVNGPQQPCHSRVTEDVG